MAIFGPARSRRIGARRDGSELIHANYRGVRRDSWVQQTPGTHDKREQPSH
jgi:hypothetical protein